jgi:hypothetical protein
MPNTLPYVLAPKKLIELLEKIKEAATPEKVTKDFLTTKIGLAKGTAQNLLPMLKRLKLVGSDGSPTELYTEFRNFGTSRMALAKAIRSGYSRLYELNEYAQACTDKELAGLVVQVTGDEKNSRAVKSTIATFNALKEFADFEAHETTKIQDQPPRSNAVSLSEQLPRGPAESLGMNVSYTINLNLPATSDIAVFNAIFKSLKENLLK